MDSPRKRPDSLKGIDDLFVVGGQPEVVTGAAIDTTVASIIEDAERHDPKAQQKKSNGEEGKSTARSESQNSLATTTDVDVHKQPTSSSNDDRPVFLKKELDLADVTPKVWKLIEEANHPKPKLFQRGGEILRIDEDDCGRPMLTSLDKKGLRHEVAQLTMWQDERGSGDSYEIIDVPPPNAIIEDLFATPTKPLSVLKSVVFTPVFAADGTLHSQPGYSPATRTYFAPAVGFEVPPVSDEPDQDEIAMAVSLISEELLGDFSFTSPAERTHAVALLLLPFVRECIDGPTPLHLIEKPTPGTGATLLAEVLMSVATGHSVAAMTEGRNEEEWRKRLFAKLRSSPIAVLIDNLHGRLDSAALASLLTAYPAWEDRLLQYSEIIHVPVLCAWIATGNNPALSNEMSRRTVRIRMDPKVDRPWLRKGFRHPDLRKWASDNRPRLVWAALTLIRAWFAAGKPEGNRSLGMFEKWAKTIGGILQVAGIEGFLGNLDEFYEASDAEGDAWRRLVAGWWEGHGELAVPAKNLLGIAVEAGLNLGKGNYQSQMCRLGNQLSRQRDRVYTIPSAPNTSLQVRIQQAGEVQESETVETGDDLRR